MSKQMVDKLIAIVPNFPIEGINFRDITPLLADAQGFNVAIDLMIAEIEKAGVKPTVIAGAESRGFIFGIAMAQKMGLGFVPVRKPKKLPRATYSVSYDLEYGSDTLEIHQDAVKAGDKVLIVDDVLATGGTAKACAELIEKAGATVAGFSFLMEIEVLQGRDKIKSYFVDSTLKI